MKRADMAAAVVGTVAALILSEGLLRLVTPRKQIIFEAEEFIQFDPLLGWTNRPGTTGRMHDKAIRTNSRGLRDHEHGPKTGRRILCLGDSFTWGLDVGDDETYPKVLEHETGVETINAGVCAWGTVQELLWLEREGFRYDPDIVTLGFYLNDFDDNASDGMFGHRRPTYGLRGGLLVLEGVPIPKPRASVGAFLLNHLLTLRLLLAGWQWLDRGFLRGADVTPIQRARLRNYPGPVPAEAETGALLTEMKRVCEARSARFLVMAIPSICLVRSSPPDCRVRDELAYAALVRLCGAAGVTVVEPLAELRRSEATGVPVFAPGRWHWNSVGHGIAAKCIAKNIPY